MLSGTMMWNARAWHSLLTCACEPSQPGSPIFDRLGAPALRDRGEDGLHLRRR